MSATRQGAILTSDKHRSLTGMISPEAPNFVDGNDPAGNNVCNTANRVCVVNEGLRVEAQCVTINYMIQPNQNAS
ncbi:hypothetical protein V5O48_008406, partial [Marasmius crinis-equi]